MILQASDLSRDGAEHMTERYEALCAHYGMTVSRNNRGAAHETWWTPMVVSSAQEENLPDSGNYQNINMLFLFLL